MVRMFDFKMTRSGYTFRADLVEDGDRCVEQVHAFAADGAGLGLLHSASFSGARLGAACREEYTRVMCDSAAERFIRSREG